MTASTSDVQASNRAGGLKVDSIAVVGKQEAAIVSLTDSTTGSATDTLNDTTASVKDDLASLAAKIEEILVAMRAHGLIVT